MATYIGITNNIRRRIEEHNQGLNRSTKSVNGTWLLIYFEGYLSKDDAVIREQRLKKHARGKQELLKRCINSLS